MSPESLLSAASVTGLDGPVDKALWLLGEGRLRGWERRKIDEVVAEAAAELLALREATRRIPRVLRERRPVVNTRPRATPPGSLSERISQLVSDAPSLSGDDFAIKALPLLMEATEALNAPARD